MKNWVKANQLVYIGVLRISHSSSEIFFFFFFFFFFSVKCTRPKGTQNLIVIRTRQYMERDMCYIYLI